MVWFFAWLIGCAICTFFARSQDRSVVGVFFGSLFLSPVLVFIYLLFAGKNGKACPKCAETVKHEASKCKHCGHEFVSTEADRIKDIENRTSKII